MLALEGFLEVSPLLSCGVYALAREGAVVYVGQSKKMLSRIAAHRSNWGRKSTPSWMPASCRGILFDQVFIRPCRVEELNALEVEMINLYKPRYNIKIKTPHPIASEFNLRVGAFILPINRPTPAFERRI